MSNIFKSYELAKEQYAKIGIDVDNAMDMLDQIPVSIHCWQCDDVAGFETLGNELTGGIQATGNYPGKASNPDELWADLSKALSYIPGRNKVNVHANYLTSGGKAIDRNKIEPEHYAGWADWAVDKKIGLDFNPTFFSHAKSASGYTLASQDDGIREFWIEHGIRSRRVAEFFGKRTGFKAANNIWIPDGEKEVPIDGLSPRRRLKASLDAILNSDVSSENHINSVESKLFGIGSEAYVAGSHEFYMGYAMQNKDVSLTLDTGHFHPTETVSSKISSLLLFVNKLLLHVSRPVRWDSDHVVTFDDETRSLMREIIRLDALDRVMIATDYFDASINRIVALTVGVRNTKKALLEALLQPVETLKKLELDGDLSSRLAFTEELKTMPFGSVWDYYCEKNEILTGLNWLNDAKQYEKDVLSKR